VQIFKQYFHVNLAKLQSQLAVLGCFYYLLNFISSSALNLWLKQKKTLWLKVRFTGIRKINVLKYFVDTSTVSLNASYQFINL
jgi:hypothetical protein